MLGLGDPPPSNPVSGPVMIDKAAHAMKEPTPFAALARFRWRALFMRKLFHCEAAYATWMHRPCHIHQYASLSIGPRFIAAGSQCRTLICKLASRWAHSPMPAAYGMHMVHRTKDSWFIFWSAKWCQEWFSQFFTIHPDGRFVLLVVYLKIWKLSFLTNLRFRSRIIFESYRICRNIRRISSFFFFPGKIRPIRISRCRNGLLWILLVWQDEIVRTQSTN